MSIFSSQCTFFFRVPSRTVMSSFSKYLGAAVRWISDFLFFFPSYYIFFGGIPQLWTNFYTKISSSSIFLKISYNQVYPNINNIQIYHFCKGCLPKNTGREADKFPPSRQARAIFPASKPVFWQTPLTNMIFV